MFATLSFPPTCQLQKPPYVPRDPVPGRLHRGVAKSVPFYLVLHSRMVPFVLLPRPSPKPHTPQSSFFASRRVSSHQHAVLPPQPPCAPLGAPQRAPYPLRCPRTHFKKALLFSAQLKGTPFVSAVLAFNQPWNFGSGTRRAGKRVLMVSDTPCSDGKGSPFFTPYPTPACNWSSPHPCAPGEPPGYQLFLVLRRSAGVAPWEESVVAPPRPCWLHPRRTPGSVAGRFCFYLRVCM